VIVVVRRKENQGVWLMAVLSAVLLSILLCGLFDGKGNGGCVKTQNITLQKKSTFHFRQLPIHRIPRYITKALDLITYSAVSTHHCATV
jgi:hypothetical protein